MTENYPPDELERINEVANKVIKEECEKLRNIAEALAESDIVPEAAKDMLASIKTEIEEKHGGEISEAKLERLARSSEKWKRFRQGQFAALHRGHKARLTEKVAYWRCRSAERSVTVKITDTSYRKKEMERLSG